MEMTFKLVKRRPVSVDKGQTIWTCGSSRSRTYRLATAEIDRRMSKVFGCFAGVLGGEELQGRYLLIDYPNRRLACGDDDMSLAGAESIPLETDRQGRPCVTLLDGVDGSKRRLLLDTGVGLTFLKGVGHSEGGFMSGQGGYRLEPDFIAEKVEHVAFEKYPLSFCGVDLGAEVGHLSEIRQKSLAKLLSDDALDGAIGYDFFRNFSVLIDREAGVLHYRHAGNQPRFRSFIEIHAPYYEVWRKTVKDDALSDYINAALPSGDVEEPVDADRLCGGVDLERATIKVMGEGGTVLFEHDLQPVGDRAFFDFNKHFTGYLNNVLPCAEGEHAVFTVCEAKCDGIGVELWTDESFDPTRIRFVYSGFEDREGRSHSLMDLQDMSYDGLVLEFEDMTGPYDAKFSRFA